MRVAVCDEWGTIIQIVVAGGEELYADNSLIQEGVWARYCNDDHLSDDDLLDKYMWVEGQGFIERPPKPEGGISGKWVWQGGQWVEYLRDFWPDVKVMRKFYLQETDYTQMPDAPLTEEQRAAWRTYRQELRDLPETQKLAITENHVVWPTPPS